MSGRERVARICGIDTGPRQHAYGVVDVEHVGTYASGDDLVQYRYVESALLPWPASMDTMLGRLASVDAVVVECPQHAYSAATASPIIETARAAGELVGALRGVIRSAGPPVRRVVVTYTTAAEWRRELLGAANAHDHAIKAWLVEHMVGMPRKSNAHTRDALAIACWAAKAVRL